MAGESIVPVYMLELVVYDKIIPLDFACCSAPENMLGFLTFFFQLVFLIYTFIKFSFAMCKISYQLISRSIGGGIN